ncbi:GIY-YIG nuclease family protein [Opitutus terrae]|uniref:Excinuclease ABC C subunit domain protein n=1 Tax=Opitutus terrae (strain DSM 11246 / JCM 15787 / PB90-1) TaxID=452637 RepID=B2A067_OPITP|nr:Excinuclease ABC C subunit domain protein [Opitutus terrae PB90-1]
MSGSHSTRRASTACSWPAAGIHEARECAHHRSASKGTSIVYFLRLRSGCIYVGVTEDLEQRLRNHVSGQACRTTWFDPPASILRLECCTSLSAARFREAQLKRWSREKKEALIEGDLDTLRALSQSR